jgi:hypothetical protein
MVKVDIENFLNECDLKTSGVISVNKTSRLLWSLAGEPSDDGKNKQAEFLWGKFMISWHLEVMAFSMCDSDTSRLRSVVKALKLSEVYYT